MKTSITSFLTLFAVPLMAQVTINQSSFPRPSAFVDAGLEVAVNGVAVPTEGLGQSWDYSGLVSTAPFSEQYFDANGDMNFPMALNARNVTYTFQAFPIRGRDYEGLDAGGWYDLGRVLFDTTHSITAISGGPNDVLNFPDQWEDYEGRIDFLSFPAGFGSSWEPNHIEQTQFNLTVAGFGLNNVPGVAKRRLSQSRSIVGEGTLIIPDAQGNPSGPLDALLLKAENITRVDSFFLGGQPAPAPLLAAFGLTQGVVAELEDFYVFYVPGFGKPVLSITINGNGGISSAAYRPDAADLATSIADMTSSAQLHAFPNPVVAGEKLHLGGSVLAQGTEVQLLDMMGRIAHSATLSGQESMGSIIVPESVTPGIYTLVARHAATGEALTHRVSIR